jgi:hypothetical protein
MRQSRVIGHSTDREVVLADPGAGSIFQTTGPCTRDVIVRLARAIQLPS